MTISAAVTAAAAAQALANVILTSLLSLMAEYEPHDTHSSRSRSVLTKTLLYQAFNTLVVPSLALTTVAALLDWVVHGSW